MRAQAKTVDEVVARLQPPPSRSGAASAQDARFGDENDTADGRQGFGVSEKQAEKKAAQMEQKMQAKMDAAVAKAQKKLAELGEGASSKMQELGLDPEEIRDNLQELRRAGNVVRPATPHRCGAQEPGACGEAPEHSKAARQRAKRALICWRG